MGLWKFIFRRGMILCPSGHYGIDIVLPVVFKDNVLEHNNMTAILYTIHVCRRIFPAVFNYMSPFDVGLFLKGDTPLPIIRMVFALASDESGITLAPQSKVHH